MKEFRTVDSDNNVYGEFDGIIDACREAKQLGCKIHVMDVKNKRFKEELSENVINYMANR